MTTYDFIIFHKNCLDGFTSFVILNKTKYISKKALIYPDVPSTKHAPSKIDNKNIIIMDVAYKCEILKEICKYAKSVLFIDHHVTIHNDVLKLQHKEKIKNLEIIYDESECGASLTWKHFFKKKPMPLFVRYIKDNDIGLWKLKWTHQFISSLHVNYKMNVDKINLKKWLKLFDSNVVKTHISKGKMYTEYIDYLTTLNSKRYSMEAFPSSKIYEDYSVHFNKPGEYKVAVFCGMGCPSSTLLGIKILETIECDFALIWTLNLDRKEYVLSFRSKFIDVGKIAAIFGGGGHTLAAACSVPLEKYNIQDLFFARSLPRQQKKLK